MKHTPVVIAADDRCQLAENPLWDAETQCVYWTDIPAGKLYRLDPVTGETRVIYEGEPVGGFTLQENGDFLLFRVNDIAVLNPSGNIVASRTFSDTGMKRFNDVIADPRGRVFAGTLGEHPKCGVHRLDLDGTTTKLFDGTGCSNGMGFSPDSKTFYWTNSTTRQIEQFDYNIETGALSNRRVFFAAGSGDAVPDGLTVDAEGCIWSARWGGGKVVRHAPDGTVLGHIKLPATNITSVCFGGKNLEELFITAAKPDDGTDEIALFCTSVGVRGKAEFRSRIWPRL